MDEFHYRADIDHGHPLMSASPGITEPNLTAEPLGTEGEMTPGPDHINPFRSEEERQIVEDIERQIELRRGGEREPVGGELQETIGMRPLGNPTEGDDPFVFDDLGSDIDDAQLPMGRGIPEFALW